MNVNTRPNFYLDNIDNDQHNLRQTMVLYDLQGNYQISHNMVCIKLVGRRFLLYIQLQHKKITLFSFNGRNKVSDR